MTHEAELDILIDDIAARVATMEATLIRLCQQVDNLLNRMEVTEHGRC
jgi:hypothetical protein